MRLMHPHGSSHGTVKRLTFNLQQIIEDKHRLARETSAFCSLLGNAMIISVNAGRHNQRIVNMKGVESCGPLPGCELDNCPSNETNLSMFNNSRCQLLPNEIWYKIATYIRPNPILLIRLAVVSKLFRAIFLSDKVWEDLNTHGPDHNFAGALLQRVPKFSRAEAQLLHQAWPINETNNLIRLDVFWGKASSLKPWAQAEYIANLDILLGRLVYYHYPGIPTRNISCALIECLMTLRPDIYYDIAKAYSSDREVVGLVVQNHGTNIEYADENIKDEFHIAGLAVSSSSWALQCLSDRLKADHRIVAKAVNMNGIALKFAASSLRSDREFVISGIRDDFYVLKYASEDLQADLEVGLIALQPSTEADERENAFAFIKRDILRDKRLALRYIRRSKIVCAYLDTVLKSDRSVALNAFKDHGDVLEYASLEMRKDKEFVKIAVLSSPAAFEYASPKLQDDFEVVATSLERCSLPFQFASQRLRKNRDSAMKAALIDEAGLQFVPEEIKKDKSFVLPVVSKHGESSQFASETLRGYNDVINTAISESLSAWKYVAL